MRGVSERTLPDLQARLGAVGLLDADPEVERLRNILASPLSDIDPDAAFDLAPVVAALEARLAGGSSRSAPCRRSSASLIDARRPAAGRRRRRGHPLRGGARPRRAVVRRLSRRRRRRSPRAAAPAEIGATSRRGSRARFLRSAGARRSGARAGCARSSSASARTPCSPPPGLEAGSRPRAAPPRVARRRARRPRLRPAIVVGAAAPFGDDRARAAFQTLIARARAAGAARPAARALATFFVVGLAARGAARLAAAPARARLHRRRRRSALARRRLPRRPACLHALRGRCATMRRAGRRSCPRATGSSCMSAAAPRAARGRLRPPLTLVATESGYDLVVGGQGRRQARPTGLSTAAVDALVAARRDLFEAEGPAA